MKRRTFKQQNAGHKGTLNRSKRLPRMEEPFFGRESKKQRREPDDVIESDESDQDDDFFEPNGSAAEEGVELDPETANEKRLRIAKVALEKVKDIAKRQREDEEGESDEEREYSMAAQFLEQEQLERSGRAQRAIAAKMQKPETAEGFQLIVKHRQSVTAIALSEDDLKGFSASKDGAIIQWDVDSGKSDKYHCPGEEVLKAHGSKDPQGRAKKHSKNVSALAVSSDGRYLATGGLDRHVHLWDTRTHNHIQALPGHRGAVSSLTFRLGTTELFSGSFDRTVKIWNAEDRTYMNTLFGHQSEVLAIDCSRKERLLTVGRDRTMQLFKVDAESRLVFRAPESSFECCCFISNDEFLSGSEDGSIELWTMLRKKPVCIVKNAHAVFPAHRNIELKSDGQMENGQEHAVEGECCSSANSWISSVAVCRDSDVAATGAGDGAVRLWAVERSKGLRPLFDLPLVGFLNSLAFAKSGRFLVAGVGQEPRLGRWGRCAAARNGVALHSLNLSEK